MMQKRQFITKQYLLALPLVILLFIAYTSKADTLTVKYTFNSPNITSVAIDDKVYNHVDISGLANLGDAGEPNLPVKGARILLPSGSEVINITANTQEKVKIGESLQIEPSQRAYPISTNPMSIVPEEAKASIYSLNNPFPDIRFQKVGIHKFRGYQILILNLFPLEYFPQTGDLFFYPEITISIESQITETDMGLYRGLESDNNAISRKIDNPEVISLFEGSQSEGKDNYDLLIITTPIFYEYFLILKEYHDTTGILTDLVTTDIVGGNHPDTVRNYITERYLNDGIEYVLIGGDDDIIPAKDLYVDAWGNIENMPADLYFGCLDGTFNYDGDSRWGEPTDGEGGGDVDLIAEVYVGRAPVGNPSEAYIFVEKTIRYLNSSDTYLNKSLMVGEDLGHPGIRQFGGNMLDKLVDSSSSNGYRTIGLPSNLYAIDSLYDRDWPTHHWPASEIIALINEEQHIINHLGHSNNGYNMRLTPLDIGFLNNDHLFLAYSQGCLAGSFDSANDCMAEQFTVKTIHGAFAAVMNARYGWTEFFKHVNTIDGPNQRFQREFWDAVFNPMEDMPELGRANQDSKEDNLYRINEGAMRWVYYQMNLFGDPTVAIKRFSSIAFEFPNGLPLIGTANQETVFEMEINGLYGGIPTPESGQLHISVNGDEFQTVSLLELSPNYYEITLPAITCNDAIEFYFSAEEIERGRLYYPHLDTPFVFTVIDSALTIFFDDFEMYNGWVVTGGLWHRNIPAGGGGEYGRPDPVSAYSGSKVYGYYIGGDYENNMSSMHLISPPIKCSDYDNVMVKYMRWLNVEETPYDYATISVSSDYLNWDIVWQNVGFIMDSIWNEIMLDITPFAANHDSVYLRWSMGPTNDSWRYSGWNIDDVEVYSNICNAETAICGDINNNGTVNILDITFLIAYLYKGGPTPESMWAADPDGNGAVNILDITYLISYLYKGGLEPVCP